MNRPETPDTVHGRLLEAVHISGYTFERACGELKWLLAEDRWRACGAGYEEIDAFLATIDLSEFRIALTERRELSKQLKDLGAGQRATGRVFGVSHSVIGEDLGTGRNRPNPPEIAPQKEAPVVTNGRNRPSEDLPSAWFQRDEIDPSKEAKRAERSDTRDRERDERRAAAVDRARLAVIDPEAAGVDHRSCLSLLDDLEAESVALVFTDPPYHDKTIGVYADLGRVAAHGLQDGGSLITYTSHHRLPEVIAMLQSAGLTFFWPLAMVHTGPKARMTEYGIVVHWKPLLWFVKGTFRNRDDPQFVNDLVESTQEKGVHPWQQSTVEAQYYIETLTVPGDLVLDPFCGGGTTAVAAARSRRRWRTCDTDEASVILARQRIHEAIAAEDRS